MTKAELEAKIAKLRANKFVPEALKTKQLAKLEAELAAMAEPKPAGVKSSKNKKTGVEQKLTFDPEEMDWRKFSKDLITEKLGKENFNSSSASWGGIENWTVKSEDDYTGDFVIIDDNNDVILMNRTEVDEEAVNEDYMRADQDDEKALRKLLKKALEMKVAKSEPTKKTGKKEKGTKPKKKYKGTNLKELNEENCKELLADVAARREASKKSAEKSRSKPVIEKLASNAAQAVKKAIESVPIEDIRANPGKEINKMEAAIKLMKEFVNGLKKIFGSDLESGNIAEEFKPVTDMVKELDKKYNS